MLLHWLYEKENYFLRKRLIPLSDINDTGKMCRLCVYIFNKL